MPIVTLDGERVEVPRDATVLQAAQKLGVWIPTLCHHPALTSAAACRLCLVELDRGKRKQLVTACNYPVRQDIAVSVKSPAAADARRGVMELLLARAPANAQLIALARRMGVEGTPYPTVSKTLRDCILCGLCTRVCEEVLGKAAIAFAGRGPDRSVSAPFRQPSEDCIGCGACAAVCPVGTIQLRYHEDTGELEVSPFKTRVKLLRCRECGERIVGAPAAQEALQRGRIRPGRASLPWLDRWGELRQLVELCPRCRRRLAAGLIGPAAALAGGRRETRVFLGESSAP